MPFLTRHRAPVLQVAWQPYSAAGDTLAANGGGGNSAVLHSLCGAGCLLRWDQLSAAVRLYYSSSKCSPHVQLHCGGDCQYPCCTW